MDSPISKNWAQLAQTLVKKARSSGSRWQQLAPKLSEEDGVLERWLRHPALTEEDSKKTRAHCPHTHMCTHGQDTLHSCRRSTRPGSQPPPGQQPPDADQCFELPRSPCDRPRQSLSSLHHPPPWMLTTHLVEVGESELGRRRGASRRGSGRRSTRASGGSCRPPRRRV